MVVLIGYAVIWTNPATNEVSYAKGDQASFYWEREADEDVINFRRESEANLWALSRVKVPFMVVPYAGP